MTFFKVTTRETQLRVDADKITHYWEQTDGRYVTYWYVLDGDKYSSNTYDVNHGPNAESMKAWTDFFKKLDAHFGVK